MLKTLLLADDSVVIQKLVGLSFANEDVELVTTDNGDDALTRARELKPDLVLADVVMPGKSGYEVCEAIKQDPDLGATPVLLLTGTFEAFDEARANAAGADGHITKPFEAQALVERVNQLLTAAAPAPASTPPVAAEPAPEAIPAPDGAADAFDFFDDEPQPVDAAIVAEAAPPSLETDRTDDLGFGDAAPESLEPLDSLVEDAPALATELEPLPESPGDHTVAFMPDAPAPNAVPDVADLDTGRSGFEIGGGESAEVGGPSDDLAAIADDSFGSQNTAPLDAASGRTQDPAATMIADDLFDSGPTDPSPSDPFVDGPDDGGFEFSFGGADAEAPAELDVGDSLGEDLAQVDPSGVSAYDVSSSDLGDPFAAPATPEVEPTPPAPTLDPLDANPVIEAAPSPSATEHDADWPSEAPSPAAPPPTTNAAPDLSPVMRERIQETLEKVAWEAFADLSDKVVKEVLQRVEAVAWEVIPQMAETLVQEEIRKMKGDDGKK